MDLHEHDDVMTEILVRLPAKSLIRFKAVCKKWRSLISSDYLCHHHTLRRPKLQPSLLIKMADFDNNEGGEKYFYFNGEKTIVPYYKMDESLTSDPPSAYISIAQGRNGLLLFSSKSDDEMFDYYNLDSDDHQTSFDLIYYVYNPTTRQSRQIIVRRKKKYPFTAAVFLAFEPSISPFYKIVCVRLTTRRDPDSHCYGVEVEVYDSESKSWKVSMETSTDVRLSGSCRTGVVHWNNIFYCKCLYADSLYYCFDFDIAKNEMMITRLTGPQTPDIGMAEIMHNYQNRNWSYLQELNGHLYHFVRISKLLNDGDGRFRSQSVAVWELRLNDDDDDDDDQCQWLFKYHGVLGDSEEEDLYSIDVLRGSDGDGDETCSLLTFSHRKMKAYSFLDNTYEDVFHFDIHSQFKSVFQFGETLALV